MLVIKKFRSVEPLRPIRWHWSRFIFVFIAVPNPTGWWQWQCGALDARNLLKHFTQRQSDSDPLHHTIHGP